MNADLILIEIRTPSTTATTTSQTKKPQHTV